MKGDLRAFRRSKTSKNPRAAFFLPRTSLSPANFLLDDMDDYTYNRIVIRWWNRHPPHGRSAVPGREGTKCGNRRGKRSDSLEHAGILPEENAPPSGSDDGQGFPQPAGDRRRGVLLPGAGRQKIPRFHLRHRRDQRGTPPPESGGGDQKGGGSPPPRPHGGDRLRIRTETGGRAGPHPARRAGFFLFRKQRDRGGGRGDQAGETRN